MSFNAESPYSKCQYDECHTGLGWVLMGLRCGMYYKPILIVNNNSRVIIKLETSLTDDARVANYDHRMFIVQATG
jgi:hypothetical protein